MINTIDKKYNDKSKFIVDDLINNVYLLPKWEKIKSFSYSVRKFIFNKKLVNTDLFRKISYNNHIEKYMFKNTDGIISANMDLRIYKDCAYIINLNFKNNNVADELLLDFIQVAAEKALYCTSDKELKINLNFSRHVNNKIRKILYLNEFKPEAAQNNYEKELFGETLTLKTDDSYIWLKRIKQTPVLSDY